MLKPMKVFLNVYITLKTMKPEQQKEITAGVFIELGQVFKDSFRSTGTNVIILMIEK